MTILYIDPSSMTYLIQILAGVVIAAGAGLAFYWKRIRRYFQNRKNPSEAETPAQAAGPDEDAGETFTADMLKNIQQSDSSGDSEAS